MHESLMVERPALRWVQVTDERGRARLEMRWSSPATASASSPAAAPRTLPAATHAA